MKAESRTLRRIFEQSVRYCVPLFQRPYVWGQGENWEPLWEDIRRLAEQRLAAAGTQQTHFIGAIVLEQLSGSTGSIETRQIIDGQQRLTTIQIVLAVLRDFCRESKLDTYEKRFAKFSQNDEAFIDEAYEAFKVWPTNPDRVSFQITLEAGSPTGLAKTLEKARSEGRLVNEQIPEAYRYFAGIIAEWVRNEAIAASPEQRMDALWQVLSGQLRLVAIDLEADDDAQVIFETLNWRGAALLPGDLIKNYLFRRADADGLKVEELYEKFWRSFDEKWWREEMRQGRLKRPRFDLYLQHFLSLQTRNDVLVTHIFETYKQVAEESRATTGDLVAQLHEYGMVFQRLVTPHQNPRVALFLRRLVAIDTATVYPVLLEAFRLYDNPQNQKELERVLIALESFLVRRMVCQLTSKNYNRLFLELLSACENDGGLSAPTLVAFLSKSEAETARWPNDDEFRTALETKPIYSQLTQPKLRMVIRGIDAAMQNQKSEDIVLGGQLTIEHLLPQSWKEHWPLATNDGATAQLAMTRDVLKHSLGNLTLLTQKLNSSISQGPWTKKRPEIVKQSKLNLNLEFHDAPTWGDEEILSRGRRLAAKALAVWPRA